jgi:hypothetical protein
MGAKKFSILAVRSPMPVGVVWTAQDRRPTEAERAYVRAKARQAARAIFEVEQQSGSATTPKGEAPCE